MPDETLVRPDGSLDLESLFAIPGNSLVHLDGDGDFRSTECEALLKEADIVATNPPFGLFREYISQLERHEKDFIILGNMNAATCKEVFPLFRDNKVWYGESIRSGDRKFYIPDGYPLNAASCGIDERGRRFIRVKGVRWFTNLDTSKRHEPITLKSVEKLIDKEKAKQEKFPEFAPNPEKPLAPILFDGENIVVVSVVDGIASENGIAICKYCCFRNKSVINFCGQVRCDAWSESVPEVIFLKEFKE